MAVLKVGKMVASKWVRPHFGEGVLSWLTLGGELNTPPPHIPPMFMCGVNGYPESTNLLLLTSMV